VDGAAVGLLRSALLWHGALVELLGEGGRE
jgi:hypothetical protein